MNTQAKQWWTMLSEKKRQSILAQWAILPSNKLGRECFSYGLVNTNLPAFAQRVVECAFGSIADHTTKSVY